MMKIIEKRGGGKKRNRGEGQVGASLGNNEEQTAVAVENSCNDDISGDSDSPLYKHAGRAQAAPTDGTYGAVAADIHLEMGEEYELSDASSQYSTKMGILTAEDLKAGTDAERYLRQDPLGRAFPERTLALLVSSSQFICRLVVDYCSLFVRCDLIHIHFLILSYCLKQVTLMLELPTLFIISGGSDKLCALIGRRR